MGPQTYSSAPFEAWFSQAEERYALPPGLLRAIAKVESGFNPRAQNAGGDRGLMQFSPPTARQYGLDPYNPRASIFAAGKYLRTELDLGTSLPATIASYNVGRDAALRGAGRGYVDDVIRAMTGNETRGGSLGTAGLGTGAIGASALGPAIRSRTEQGQPGDPTLDVPGFFGEGTKWYWPPSWGPEVAEYVKGKAVPIIAGSLIIAATVAVVIVGWYRGG